jgi:hypothetical protein
VADRIVNDSWMVRRTNIVPGSRPSIETTEARALACDRKATIGSPDRDRVLQSDFLRLKIAGITPVQGRFEPRSIRLTVNRAG